MNKQPIRGAESGGIAEDQVADYLLAHPEFFERHAGVLTRLKLPHHQRGTAAISLVERQVLVLREKHAALEKKLHELIDNGRANEAIVDRVHRLTRRLLRATDVPGLLAALEASLLEDFGASRWTMLLTGSVPANLAAAGHPHLRIVPRARAAARSATRSAITSLARRLGPWARRS